jgi:hypothetical protein
VYAWHAGYWGPHIGYYGGVNYGFGYGGVGYVGGGWYGGHFRYNKAVTNVNTTIVHNTYVNRTVVNNVTVNRVSYNGGPGGVTAQPTADERVAMNEHHVAATNVQVQHQEAARVDRNAYVSVNHGRPATLATARPVVNNHVNNAAHVGTAPRTNTVQHNTTPVNRTQLARPQVNRPQQHTVQPMQHNAQPVAHPAPHAQPAHGGAPEHEHHRR